MVLACGAGVGVLQGGAGLFALRGFLNRRALAASALPPVTILKPVHGDEPLLEAALESACRQDYPDYQVVFGVQDPQDSALPVLRRLQARYPHVSIDVVIDRTQHGVNRKVGNLMNMMAVARHDVLVIADSDMHVAGDYLRRLVAALDRPGVGLVTTLYTGRAAQAGLTGQLGVANINHSFLPGALLARWLGREDCLGATMALTRQTLERVGGMRALVAHLADDAVLGRLVQGLGLRIDLADTVPATTVPESRVPALFEHELRWARTVKSLVPREFAVSAVQHPMVWAALALCVSGGAGWGWAVLAAVWAWRVLVAHAIDRSLGVASGLTIWCVPLRDILSVAVILASYRTRQVAWRGQVLLATSPALAPGKG